VLNGESPIDHPPATTSQRQHTTSITSQGLDHRASSLRRSADKRPSAAHGDGGSDWWAQLKANWLPTLIYSVLVYVVVYTWYLSLSRTFVSVNTAIYNSSCVFVFVFSVAVLKEKVSVLKIVAVVCCLGGVTMLCVDGITNSSGHDNKGDVWGYALVIASTILYSLYEVLFKRWGSYKEAEPTLVIAAERSLTDDHHHHHHHHHHHEEEVQDLAPADGGGQLWKRLRVVEHTMLFIGLLGVWTLLLAWPGIIIVDKAGIESFELPHGYVMNASL
jgi:multidrug transporter EmrE-like cation transporter